MRSYALCSYWAVVEAMFLVVTKIVTRRERVNQNQTRRARKAAQMKKGIGTASAQLTATHIGASRISIRH